MRQSIISNGLMLVALLLAGPLAWLLTSRVLDATGGHGSSLLLSASPTSGLLRGIGAILLAGVIGVITTRLVTLRWALWNSGVVLAWAAAGLGTADSIVRARGGTPAAAQSMLTTSAIETAIIGVLIVALAILVERLRADKALQQYDDADETPAKRIGMIAASGLAAGGTVAIVTLIVMINNLKGQAIFSVAAGSAVGAVVAGLVRPRGPLWVVIAGAVLAGTVGPIVVKFLVVPSQLVEQIYAVTLPGIARVTPMDYAAGAMLGTPIGVWLAIGLIEKAEDAHASKA